LPSPRFLKGARGEETAVQHLQREGYRVVERNYRCRRGEIDIIAEESQVLCFVEVRSCHSAAFGGPLATVSAAKQARIIRAARHYLMIRGWERREIRFDVVGITYEPELQIQLVRGAFEVGIPW
jgi:putative endonuclease